MLNWIEFDVSLDKKPLAFSRLLCRGVALLFIVKYIFALLIAQAIVGPETSKKCGFNNFWEQHVFRLD